MKQMGWLAALAMSIMPPNVATAESLVRPSSYGRPIPVTRVSVVQSLVGASGNRLVHPDPFAVGRSVIHPQTPFMSLEQIVNRTAGRVSERAFQRYRTFSSYWQVSGSQRTGKALEALIAFLDNERWIAAGSRERSLVTAAEGGSHHGADLVRLGRTSEIVGHYQVKLGWQQAVNALRDPRYEGMFILTTQDSLDVIERQLLRCEQSALRRGHPLGEPWCTVRRALEEGRLLRTTPAGASLPSRAMAELLARDAAQQCWEELQASASQSGRMAGRWGRIVNAGGRLLIVADTAGSIYFTYQDVGRYQAGEIGPGYLSLKLGIRGAQQGFAYYALFTPEPSTKLLATTVVVVLVAVDVGSEWVHELALGAERRTTQRILETIDREERYHAVRRVLGDQMKELSPAAGQPVR